MSHVRSAVPVYLCLSRNTVVGADGARSSPRDVGVAYAHVVFVDWLAKIVECAAGDAELQRRIVIAAVAVPVRGPYTAAQHSGVL
mmetsp:Transcript_96749/g.141535  ORF Transcript_96749/g.141535 Transcript_96749/m.141535 type:complete len:85 (+) Transcript_96749:366-620(+)